MYNWHKFGRLGVSVKQLSALQIAQIGAAVATLSGVGGAGANPLMAVQKSLGLDRLAVGGTSTGGASVEAGRYVSERVYVGAKQTTSGATQAQGQSQSTTTQQTQTQSSQPAQAAQQQTQSTQQTTGIPPQ